MWKVSVTNNDGGAEVDIGSEKWVLLDRGDEHKNCDSSKSWFDLAVRKESQVTSINNGFVLTGAVGVVYCNRNTQKISFNASSGKWTDKYLFGWVRGDSAGVTFGINKTDVFEKNAGGTVTEMLRGGVEEPTILNKKFVEDLKQFNGRIGGLGGRLGEWERNDGRYGRPVYWGTVFYKSGTESQDITCNSQTVSNSFWKCDWGIIDVSRVARA